MSSSLEKLPDALFANCLSFLQPDTYTVEKQEGFHPIVHGRNKGAVLFPVSQKLGKMVQQHIISLDAPNSNRKACGAAVRILDLREYRDTLLPNFLKNALQSLPQLVKLHLPFEVQNLETCLYPKVKELDATKASHDLCMLKHFPALEKLSVYGLDLVKSTPHLQLPHLKSFAIARSQRGGQGAWTHVWEALMVASLCLEHIQELIVPELFLLDGQQLQNFLSKMRALRVIEADYSVGIDGALLKQCVPNLRILVLSLPQDLDGSSRNFLAFHLRFKRLSEALGDGVELIVKKCTVYHWQDIQNNYPYLQHLEVITLGSIAPAEIAPDWKRNLPHLRTIIFPLFLETQERGLEQAIEFKTAWPEVEVYYNRLRVEVSAPQTDQNQAIVVDASTILSFFQAVAYPLVRLWRALFG